jgi:hypothetical protein
MSQTQSDYILRKKMTFELQNQTKLPAVLSSKFYTLAKQYSIENEIIKESIAFGKSPPPLQTDECPVFIMCINTNTRPNRVLMTNDMFSFPTKYIKQRAERKCFNCCYNSQYNLYTTNNQNTLFSTCSNKRLNALKCNDSLITGGLCSGVIL